MKRHLTAPNGSLLFVYGTLRRGSASAEAPRLHAECAWLGTARAGGRLYRVGWYPALVIAADRDWVTGDVLRMADPPATLAWLDAYEECGPGFSEPQEYRRDLIEIVLAGEQVRAWAYLYNRPVDGLEAMSNGDWLGSQDLASHTVDQPDSR